MFAYILKKILKPHSDALCFVLIIGSAQDEEQSSHTNQSLPIFAQQIASSGKKIVVANFDPGFRQMSVVHDGNLHVYKSSFQVPHALPNLQEAAHALNAFISTNVNKKLVIIDHTSPSVYSARQLYSQLTIKKQTLLIMAYYAAYPAIILDEKTASMTGRLSEHGRLEADVFCVFGDSLMQDEVQLLKKKSMAVVNDGNKSYLEDQSIMGRKTIVDHRATKVTFQNWQIFYSVNAISQDHIFSKRAPDLSERTSASASPTSTILNPRGSVTPAQTMTDVANIFVLFALEHPYLTAGIVAALAVSAIILTIATCGFAANAAVMLGSCMGLTGQAATTAGTCVAAFIGGGLAGGCFTLFATRVRAQENVGPQLGMSGRDLLNTP